MRQAAAQSASTSLTTLATVACLHQRSAIYLRNCAKVSRKHLRALLAAPQTSQEDFLQNYELVLPIQKKYRVIH
jgi:hypothetical protein